MLRTMTVATGWKRLLFGAAALVGTTSAVSGQTTIPIPDGAKVHALLAIDTNTNPPMEGLNIDELRMAQSLLRGIPDRDRLELKVFRGDDVTPEKILNYLSTVAVGPSDTLLFYYSGHGATHPRFGHALTMACRRPLLRSQLRDVMKRRNARLTVILTDCCSTLIELPPSKISPAPQAPGMSEQPTISAVMRCLLFRHQGVVDITSSSYDANKHYGEASLILSTTGSFFTANLADTLMYTPLDEMDVSPKDGFLQWNECFAVVMQGTQRMYREFKASTLTSPPAGAKESDFTLLRQQSDQTPQAYSLGVRSAGGGGGEPGPANGLFAAGLGITYELEPFQKETFGARLIALPVPRSPAAGLGLEVGDMIISLDGLPIRGPEDVVNHYARTTLVFVNVRTGGAQSAVVVLPAMADRSVGPRYALGVMTVPVVLNPGQAPQVFGLRVTQVFQGGAAARSGLEPGDVIVRVNGTAVGSQSALSRAIAGSGGRLTLTVRNPRLPRRESQIEVQMSPGVAPGSAPAPPAEAPPAPPPPQ